MWRLNCKQLAHYNTKLVEKRSKIAALKTQLKTKRRRNREVIVPDEGVAWVAEAVEHRTSPSQTAHVQHCRAQSGGDELLQWTKSLERTKSCV